MEPLAGICCSIDRLKQTYKERFETKNKGSLDCSLIEPLINKQVKEFLEPFITKLQDNLDIKSVDVRYIYHKPLICHYFPITELKGTECCFYLSPLHRRGWFSLYPVKISDNQIRFILMDHRIEILDIEKWAEDIRVTCYIEARHYTTPELNEQLKEYNETVKIRGKLIADFNTKLQNWETECLEKQDIVPFEP